MWYAIVLHTYIVLRKASAAHLQNPSKIPIVLSRYNQNQKINQKTNPWKDSVINPWYSVSVFWFKLCSRRLTERNAAIISSNNIYYWNMNIDKPCHNSFCEPRLQNEGQKNSRISPMHTESFTRIFLTFVFWCKGIINGFASVTACGCCDSDCRVISYYFAYIYCPKESKCRHLQNPSKIPLSCQGTIKIKR